MGALQVDPHVESRGPDAIIVRIVDVEDQIESAPREPQPGEVDLLELEVRLFERQTS